MTNQTRKTRVARQRDKGAVAVLAVLVLLIMGGAMALALNAGAMMDTRAELQNASDSAALAGARSLNGTKAGVTDARDKSVLFAAAHRAFGDSVKVRSGGDVRFGVWHYRSVECAFGKGSDCFEELNPDAIDPRLGTANYFRLNAVKILDGRDGGGRNAPLPAFFTPFLGGPASVNIRSAAVAVGNRSRVDCTLPFGIAACKILRDGSLPCDGTPVTVSFQGSKDDEIGYINVINEHDNPSESFVRDAIANKDALCAAQDFTTGEALMREGNSLNPTVKALTGEDGGGPCLLGTVQTVAVTDNEGCPGDPIFHHRQMVIGYVNARIVEATCPDGSKAVCPTGGGKSCQGGGKGDDDDGGGKHTIKLEVLCDEPAGPDGGAGPKLRLVQ